VTAGTIVKVLQKVDKVIPGVFVQDSEVVVAVAYKDVDVRPDSAGIARCSLAASALYFSMFSREKKCVFFSTVAVSSSSAPSSSSCAPIHSIGSDVAIEIRPITDSPEIDNAPITSPANWPGEGV
jgi:hypothetical protein